MKIKHLFLGMLLLVMVGCSSDDNDNNTNDNMAEIQDIIATVEAGTWHVSSYVDSGVDETSDYNGYDFTFATNGTISASNGTTTINGTWWVDDDDNSCNCSDDIDFNIAFAVVDPDPFAELNDDWDVASHTSSMISLRDVSGGGSGTDTLVFVKN